jgi:hypothetical protein
VSFFRLPHRCHFVLVTVLLVVAAQLSAAENMALRSALKSITAESLQSHVDVLADDSLEGRRAGTRGGRAAAAYLTKQLQQLKLQGAGDRNGFYQTFGGGMRNLLAVLPGSDKKLKDRYIIVSAHYDHVGYGEDGNTRGGIGYIHNGADDNASGTSGLVEVAKALASLDRSPRRSILFAFWDGEEKGLLGSRHWMNAPTRPLKNVDLMINLDMIGRLRSKGLEIGGARTSDGLRRLVCRHNQQLDIALRFNWKIKRNSDHFPFYEAGIPYLMFHTGLHDDYHHPNDDADKTNAEGMQRVARLVAGVAHGLANQADGRRFRSQAQYESPWNRKRRFRPIEPMPGRFGVRWTAGDKAENGLRLTRILDDTPAMSAGLKAGDRIIKIAGVRVTSVPQFRSLLLASPTPATMVIERQGEEKPITKSVPLNGSPVRVGFSWRMDNANPGMAVLVRVVPGSPADLAGLKVHDRIYQMGGKRLVDSDDLLRRAKSLTEPTELVIERKGRKSTVIIIPVVLASISKEK